MRILLVFALLIFGAHHSRAQDLTVHIIDESNTQPIENALVRLHYGCSHSMRPIELKQKTDAAGIAIFCSVSVSPIEFCVFPDYAYDAQEQPFMFTSPSDAQNQIKYLGTVFTTLPNEVTFHVRRLTFLEHLRKFLRYD
jgi:hypothetical protein